MWHLVVQGMVGRGKAREVAKWKGMAVACVCSVRVCVWWRGCALAACIGGRLARSFVECGGGGVAWVWLNVDVDSGGGGAGGGSRMKGKRRQNKAGIAVGRMKRMHRDPVRKNCGAHSTLAQIFEGVRDRRAGPFPSPACNPALHHHKWQTLDEDVEDSDEGVVVTVARVVGGVIAALARMRRRTGTYSLIGSSRN
jgi:hypothetical protein